MSVISNVLLQEKRTVRQYATAYKVRADRPHVWLQRACCWVLRKLHAEHFEEAISFVRIDVNADTFMERIFKSQMAVHEFVGKPGAVLLIGSEDWAHLMASKEYTSMFSFKGKYSIVEGSGRPRLMGLRVHVLPYLRGIAVLPEGL